MDKIFIAGTMKVFSALSLQSCKIFDLKKKCVYQKWQPRKDWKRKIKENYYTVALEIRGNKKEIGKKREEAGCFVLLTNLPLDGEYGRSR